MANGKLYPGGVNIATPFEMNDSQPIVSYMVVNTIANRDLLPNQFDGMNTFVVEAQVMYCKTNAGWVPVGCLSAECIESMPLFDNELEAISLEDYSPYRTSTGELRYKLPYVEPPINWIDLLLWSDAEIWID